MTTAVRTPPNHDTLTCYKNYGCRLPACVERNRAYNRTITRRRAYGTWQPFVDAEPVRQHILTIQQAGVSLARIVALTGLAEPTVGRILYSSGKRPPHKRLRPEHANRILAVTAQHARPDRIDATGTRRRIEALQVIGWPKQYIAERLGLNISTAGRVTRQNLVRSSTAYAVAALYCELKVKLPEAHGMIPWVVERTRRHAHAQGWHGPLAWDGNIDDPDAQPDTEGAGYQPPPKRDELRPAEIEHLAGFGLSEDTIARQVGLPVKDVHSRLLKIRAKAAASTNKEQVAA